MSHPLDKANIITVKDINFTSNLITVGIAALVGYDYLLTVQRESRLFWKRRGVNAATILFFVNRYTAVIYYVGLAYYRCLSLPLLVQYYIDMGIRYFQYLPWAVFSALRVFALGHRNWLLSGLTFFWSMLAFPLDAYGDFHHTSFVEDPIAGCLPAATTPTSLSLVGQYGTIVIRGGQIVADVVVIGITWRATYYALSEGSMCFLTRVMLKHGTLYFLILLVLNILHTVFIFLPNSLLHIPFTNTSYVTRVSEPITAILVSRFILDLHEAHRGISNQPSGLTGIQVMGSDIGQPCSQEFASIEMELEEWSVRSNKAWRDTDLRSP
ncbi:hypothetical protein GSI_15483 [Ganoderma sinense ZZ0214-1]|uniref:DUF6533 domain-containing protein n=1 Tax=Ganoderma sinense ZZ0214-1 TaxID=1077348 RepID=A0A2G8RN94_9APHY|nr:hypothetical protein GSI_15483 [Ganoderma sinense ZZ0214-1]